MYIASSSIISNCEFYLTKGSRREIKVRGSDNDRLSALEQLKRARQGGQASIIEQNSKTVDEDEPENDDDDSEVDDDNEQQSDTDSYDNPKASSKRKSNRSHHHSSKSMP